MTGAKTAEARRRGAPWGVFASGVCGVALGCLGWSCSSSTPAPGSGVDTAGTTASSGGGAPGGGGASGGAAEPSKGGESSAGVSSSGANSAGANLGGGSSAGTSSAGVGGVPRADGGAGGALSSGAGQSGSGAAAGNSPNPTPLVPGAWGDQGDGTFKNPVLWADYNNLDVIGVGSNFYMIAASHHFMGMPVLQSKDLVNWSLASRIYRRLELDPRYDTPGQAYQNGTWAPAIRYHEGRFWVYVTTPTEGLIMTSAVDAAGPWAPWTVVAATPDWEDPCPFWDDVENVGGDGPKGQKAYLVRSQLGAGPLFIQQLSWDGKKLLGVATTVATGPTLEGPKLHKRNGYYYIFAPEGGIDNGYQVVLRSRTLLGPYTKKTILERGSTSTNGPHQGSWLDLASGQSWFYHFQQNGGWGRVAHLQPAAWGSDDWPKIGVDLDGNGIGEPVARPKKPDVSGSFAIQVPQSSDEFADPALGLQWLWNHNPDDSKWSLGARPGWLRLSARPLSARSGRSGIGGAVPFVEDDIAFAYNTLVQLAMGKVASAVTQLDASGMVDGQRAGITLFGQDYGWIGVVDGKGQLSVRTNLNGTYTTGPTLSGKTVYLKASINDASRISFAYSTDGVTFSALGGTLLVGRTWFEGIKFGLFTYQLSTGVSAGSADFDFFHYTHDGARPAAM